MPVVPKRLLLLGAGFASLRKRIALALPGRDHAFQAGLFREAIHLAAQTHYGQAVGIGRRMAYQTFRERVPLADHRSIAPYLDRSRQGEAHALSPGVATEFALTAGTTTGRQRLVPYTPHLRHHYQAAWREVLIHFLIRTGSTAILNGRHLFLDGSESPRASPDAPGRESASTSLAMRDLPAWAVHHFKEPAADPVGHGDWDARLDGIVEQTWNRPIALVAGPPTATLDLATRLQHRVEGNTSPGLLNLQRLWPGLRGWIHAGEPHAPLAPQLRSALGPSVVFHEVYGAAEGVFAVQDADDPGLRLLTRCGHFFEFIPATEVGDTPLASAGPRALRLNEIQAGVDYALVVTTPGSLTRFVVGDIVRFVSTLPPRLIWIGRVGHSLNAAGERTTEKDLVDALTAVCRQSDWHIVNFHVAPLSSPSSVTGHRRVRHEWWVELRAGTNRTPTGPVLAVDLDRELRSLNSNYHSRRDSGALDSPVVRLVIPGVFEQWMKRNGQWGGIHKMPRALSQRRIADGLADLTRFTEDETRGPWSRG